ncbi:MULTISPECIES: TetR/AcrR family transcriptional regulator [Nocardia]|uniref:TetR/AcrR family transcriptional regulator n=1 Tax=Nocardia TaxID=1817 RepID=UPI000D685B67|nr:MULTISPECIES: TetR/AcrR family transcriptional regulator [Nocardia]
MTAAKRATAVTKPRGGESSDDGTRRTEILMTAETLFATSGLRTSLQEIADAAGILPGSLYHHFDSKEAILVELMRRYHADLDRVAEAAVAELDESDERSASDRIVELGTAIAECAVRNRAALQMSFFEGPSATTELTALTQLRPVRLNEAMLQTLRAGRWSGYIRSDIDLPVLADRICQSMLHVGLDVIRHKATPARVATLLCRILLEGIASGPLGDAELDRSAAFAAVSEVIDSWAEVDVDASDKARHVRAAGRAVFGRRGYEATTARDIAAAAGMATGTVYRLIGSKDQLLASIMQEFGEKVGAGWIAALNSDSSVLEKLDALSWINIMALERFPDEFRIQLAWMRQSPPDTPNPGWSFAARVRQMKSMLTAGIRAGDISVESRSTEMLARCFIGVQWIPENILRQVGPRRALQLVRDTSLRGVVAH